jgi:hypothetical protein
MKPGHQADPLQTRIIVVGLVNVHSSADQARRFIERTVGSSETIGAAKLK